MFVNICGVRDLIIRDILSGPLFTVLLFQGMNTSERTITYTILYYSDGSIAFLQ